MSTADGAAGGEVGASTRIRLASLSGRGVVPYVAAFAIALAIFLHAYQNISAQPMTGDEPSYLLDAFSMARDGDRDLSNQYSFKHPEQLAKLFGGTVAYPHVLQLTSAGQISWHGAGVGFAVVPGVWVGDWLDNPVKWVRLELVLIDALAALALFGVVRRAAQILRIRMIYAWAAWASAVVSLPLVAYADQLYPEVPALLCILLALNAAMRPRPGWRTILAGSIAASYLPWIHIRFIPVCFGLLLALALRGLATPSGASSGGLRDWVQSVPSELGRLGRALWTRSGAAVAAATALPALFSFGLMAIEFQRWYGSPQWTATGGGGGGAPAVVTNTWYPAIFGGIFGSDYGWVPWAPVAVLALAALGSLVVLAPRWTLYGLLIVAVYEFEIAFSGIPTPGFVFPGRYEIAVFPLLAVGLMVVLARIPVTWVAFVPLMLATLAISWQASGRSGVYLLNTGTVQLPAAAHLESAFPDIERPAFSTAFIADPASLSGTVGILTPNTKERVSQKGSKPGFLVAGPRSPLAAGSYTAHFLITQFGGTGSRPIARLEVWSVPNQTFAQQVITPRELPSGKAGRIDVPFATPGGAPVETRVFVTGAAQIRVAGTSVDPVLIAITPGGDRYPSGALMAAWTGGTLFLGALFGSAVWSRRRRDAAPAT